MSAFNLWIGMCLVTGHDWIYLNHNTVRICATCDLKERV